MSTVEGGVHLRVDSQLSPNWLPQGAGVSVFVIHDPECAQWEAVIPKFSIAGMGDTWRGAVENAFELLYDYLYLCQEEGRTYEASFRRLGAGSLARIVAKEVATWARAKFGGPGGGSGEREEYLRLPRLPITTAAG